MDYPLKAARLQSRSGSFEHLRQAESEDQVVDLRIHAVMLGGKQTERWTELRPTATGRAAGIQKVVGERTRAVISCNVHAAKPEKRE